MANRDRELDADEGQRSDEAGLVAREAPGPERELRARVASLEAQLRESREQCASERAARRRLEEARDRQAALAESRGQQLRDYQRDLESSGAFRLARLLSRVARPFGARWLMRRLRARAAAIPSAPVDAARLASGLPAREPGAAAPAPRADPEEAPPSDGRPTVAAILDEFSAACFRPECRLLGFRPDTWRAVLDRTRPDLLLVESAWHGNDDAWVYRVARYEQRFGNELRELVAWCRERSIPTVFWNKEDPVHFERFLDAAGLFDVVLTSDGSCIERYREALGHDRVHALPFAAQPALHNPIVRAERSGSVCFAGSYYRGRHSRRREDMEVVLEPALDYALDIYDRTLGSLGRAAEEFGFPETYREAVRGRLDYAEVVEAYKRYRVFLNVNSVVDSPTMFSRRVFEILACGTPMVSAWSLGIERLLGGDVVRMSRSADETRKHLDRLLGDDACWARTAATGLCRVLADHTYAHRLATIARLAGAPPPPDASPNGDSSVAILAEARDAADLERIGAFAREQSLPPHEIGILVPDGIPERERQRAGRALTLPATWIPDDDAPALERWRKASSARWLALVRGRDRYGPLYLEESLLAFRYAPTDFVARPAHFAWNGHRCELRDERAEHRVCERVPWGSLVGRRERFTPGLIRAGRSEPAGVAPPGGACGFHRFNYVLDGGAESADAARLSAATLPWRRRD